MLIFFLCAAMMVTWGWPQTPVGRVLRRLMVEWPARQLARLDLGKVLPKRTAGRVLLVLLVLFAVAAAVLLARNGALVFLAQGLPEGVAWFAAFDIATYLDVMALAVVLSATVRVRAIYAALRAWIARSALGRLAPRGGGARSRSPRPQRRPQPPSNDDEQGWRNLGLALRAA
ncbi:MAG TPA: hypothetical protein VGN89_03645 [Phenylobacterium sp.]|nr:hypothetical protein [Phenylobacterium sp.]